MKMLNAIRQSLDVSVTTAGTKIFPTLIIERSHQTRPGISAADRALEFYRLNGFFGDRSTKGTRGYGQIIRSLNCEPPWVESLEIGESLGQILPKREFELRPFTKYVQDLGEEVLMERFHQHLLQHDLILEKIIGLDRYLNDSYLKVSHQMQLDEFKSLVGLAKSLGPSLAYDLEQTLLYEFGGDSSGVEVGTGAPDLLLWTSNGEDSLWFFSEVKAHGDYLSTSQKAWLTQNWNVIQGHFLLTILA